MTPYKEKWQRTIFHFGNFCSQKAKKKAVKNAGDEFSPVHDISTGILIRIF